MHQIQSNTSYLLLGELHERSLSCESQKTTHVQHQTKNCWTTRDNVTRFSTSSTCARNMFTYKQLRTDLHTVCAVRHNMEPVAQGTFDMISTAVFM